MSNFCFTQDYSLSNTKDSSYLIIPYNVATQIALDLNRKDLLEKLYDQSLVEINYLKDINNKQNMTILKLNENISGYEESETLLKNVNIKLEKDNKKLNTKNKIITYVGGGIVAVLVTLLIIK